MEKKETKDNTEEKPLAENGDDKAENNHLPLPPEINNNAEDTVVHIIDHPKPSKFKEYFDALLFAGLVALILKIIFIEAYRIPTGSMENTLLIGDFLLVNKFNYGATTPRNIPFTDIRTPFFRFPALKDLKKGDVVVFDYPGDNNELRSKEVINYIKRLVVTRYYSYS
jgi:signal peptidase I